jgi:MioC protein
MDFSILVGTMTGTAELVAEEIDLVLNNSGQNCNITLIDNFKHNELESINNLVICSSTYGQGDVPDGSQSFYDFLSNSKNKLSHLRYGVFALGDMTYAETFCFGGKKFDDALSQLNAKKAIDTFCHNASDGSLPEEHAPDWAKEFLKNISEIK